ncbi:MAG: hypothetical protein R2828_00785 [Saprospiraceae bacterium]
MKKSILILLALFCCCFLSGQRSLKKIREEVQTIQSKKLVVMVEEPFDDRTSNLKRKKNPEGWAAYDQSLESYNAWMKEVVEKYWTLSDKTVLYKTKEQIDEMKKNKDADKYILLYCTHRRPLQTSGGIALWDRLFVSNLAANQERNHKALYAEIRLSTLEEYGKNSPIHWLELANVFPEKADLVYGIQAIQRFVDHIRNNPDMDRKELLLSPLKADKSILKDKILLFRADWFDEEFDSTTIANYYPHPYRIVSPEEFNQLVFEGAAQYAYVMIIPDLTNSSAITSLSYYHLLIDAANGEVLDVINYFSGKGKSVLGISISKNNGKYFDQGIADYAQ